MKSIISTKNIRNPTTYVVAVNDDYKDWVFDEERVLSQKSLWRSQVFQIEENAFVDLEIGTGNGYFFTHHLQQNPNRKLIGLEIKFKPLIQTIRRALKAGQKNGRVARIQGERVDEIFSAGELDNVYIFFPDPWEKRKRQKNRLVQTAFLNKLFALQKPNSILEFKTDHAEYFTFALAEIEKSNYKIECVSYDFHKEPDQTNSFKTHFEKLFHDLGQPIHFCRMVKAKIEH